MWLFWMSAISSFERYRHITIFIDLLYFVDFACCQWITQRELMHLYTYWVLFCLSVSQTRSNPLWYLYPSGSTCVRVLCGFCRPRASWFPRITSCIIHADIVSKTSMSRVVDSQAFVAGSGVSLTRIPEEKRRALDGFDYTFSDFLSYYGDRLA